METPEKRIQRVVREEIAIAPYNPDWPKLFLQEKEHLLSCLPHILVPNWQTWRQHCKN